MLNSFPHTLMSDLTEALGFRRNFSHHVHSGSVNDVTIFLHGDIKIDDVAIFQNILFGRPPRQMTLLIELFSVNLKSYWPIEEGIALHSFTIRSSANLATM